MFWQLIKANGWIWTLRYELAWLLGRWQLTAPLADLVWPVFPSDEVIRRAISNEVKPLFPPEFYERDRPTVH